VTYRWFRWWTVLTVPLVPGPFIIGGMMFVEAYTEHPQKVLGGIPILLFSIILSYYSIAFLSNSTRVAVEGDLITVRHGPVPWRGCAFRLKDCSEFYVGKVEENRFGGHGVRVRFFDGTSEPVAFSGTAERAKEWVKRLNLHVEAKGLAPKRK
jgi:hypothetical protein